MKRKTLKRLCALFLLCASVTGARAVDWILAAKEFSFTEDSSRDSRNQNLTSLLPSLILERISQDASRTTTNEELLNRTLSSLLTGRQSLFLELSSAIRGRDALVLTETNERRLRRALEERDGDIAEIKAEIDENLSDTRRVREEYEARVGGEDGGGFVSDQSPLPFNPLRNLFVTADEDLLPEQDEEDLAFYGDDVHSLFSFSDEAAEAGLQSRQAEREITSASINGLIDGTLTVYGDYFSATCTLYNYPGATVLGEVTEVGAVSDMVDVAENIADYFTPLIANKDTVDIYFSIGPEEILDDILVIVDSDVHRGVPESITVAAGRHSIQIECDGYVTRSIVYNFEGSPAFLIKGDMREEQSFSQPVSFEGADAGSVYLGTDLAGDITEQSRDVTFTLRGAAELGQFRRADDSNALFFFYIPQTLEQMGQELLVRGNPVNHQEYVERRRILTYRAYSAFVLSVPVTLALWGQATSILRSGAPRNEATGWNVARYASLGVTIGLGIFWGFELVRYLIAANSLLPVQVESGY